MLSLRTAVHLEREDHRQLRRDECALGNRLGHRVERLDGAEGVAVRHNRVLLPVPAVDLDVATALKKTSRLDTQEAFAGYSCTVGVQREGTESTPAAVDVGRRQPCSGL